MLVSMSNRSHSRKCSASEFPLLAVYSGAMKTRSDLHINHHSKVVDSRHNPKVCEWMSMVEPHGIPQPQKERSIAPCQNMEEPQRHGVSSQSRRPRYVITYVIPHIPNVQNRPKRKDQECMSRFQRRGPPGPDCRGDGAIEMFWNSTVAN